MSGGAYDYVYSKIEEINVCSGKKTPHRAAFQNLLKVVAKAMHDIEWVDSGDYGEGDENEAIDKCFHLLKPDTDVCLKAAAFDSIKEQLQIYFKDWE